ncbi:MAG: flagellar biosynthetic protein FliR [Lachnospiraceae bacterium]|nr:flagellar biosynthetic protein FliR [Lachnospiraceae bacterium]MBR0149380.1 flagellar biosynthetic protein FliR [Lachnospiraceae bacterium]MBR4175521.1 flagellar biosynthetic protein FliR [Lachnospiraceae bacterium]
MLNLAFSIQDFEYFLLVFTRITAFFVTAPFFSTQNVPRRFKAGLGLFTAMLVYTFVVPHHALAYNTVWGYGLLVLKESMAGAVLGLMTNLPLAILTFSGKLMDMESGLSMLNIFDPTTRVNEGFSGMLYHYMVLLILMISGMHHYLIKAMVDAFELIPVGNVVFNYDMLPGMAMQFLTEYVGIGFRICLPIFGAILVTNVVLGINAKIAPQMNMFAVGIQIKLLAGLTIMMIITITMPTVSSFIYEEIKKMMVVAVQIMST